MEKNDLLRRINDKKNIPELKKKNNKSMTLSTSETGFNKGIEVGKVIFLEFINEHNIEFIELKENRKFIEEKVPRLLKDLLDKRDDFNNSFYNLMDGLGIPREDR